MKVRVLVALGCVGALAVVPAHAYDGQEQDFSACTQGQGKIDDATVVAACTRLIDNAAAENELVGFFHALRASANNDKASNCADAHKVLELTKDPTFVDGAKTLIKVNC